jgi:hypothetical protein
MSNNINISNLRTYLNSIVSNQAKTAQPSYINQVALVGSVATTSKSMNINPDINSPNIINPIPVNTNSSFISTSDNQVSVTSSGKEDTIIVNNLLNIVDIEDVTNSGYTRNNSILNLYDPISSNYWNPQVNITGSNPYFYKLNYTFDATGPIYKFSIKNNNDFPGFTNIKLYSTDTPSNYVNITPAINTNNQYVNTSIALLLDQNGNLIFNDTNKMTAEFTLEPSVQPNTFYQYGQCYGVMYTGDAIGLRAGNYINTNTGTGNKLQWVTSYLLNQTTSTGTNNTDNNYLVSYDGQYRIAQNRNFYQLSTDGGVTYTQKTLITTTNMKSTSNGQCIVVMNTNQIGIISNDYGNSFNSVNLNSSYGYDNYTLSYDGQYQTFVSNSLGYPGTNLLFSVYKSENYGTTFIEKFIQYTVSSLYDAYVINVIENVDGTILVVSNVRQREIQPTQAFNAGPIYYSIMSPGSPDTYFTNTTPSFSDTPIILSSLEQNYTGNVLTEGKFKTGFGLYNFGGFTGTPSFFVTTDDSTYIRISDSSLFIEYYNNVSPLSNRLYIRNSQIKISPDGSKQIARVQWYYAQIPQNPDFSTYYYSTNSGSTWNRSSTPPSSIFNTFSNIVANNDFSIIQICGGYTYSYNGQTRTDPISYISYDYGNNWILNSAINPASSLVYTNFYSIKSVTNKTYFQIKDLSQNQVLGVSDNGFNMTKDLRVNNSDAYILGGKMTVGPDEASSLLNDYDLNIDGTLSTRNIFLVSDERLKNVIEYINIKEAYDKIKELQVVKYKYKDVNIQNKEKINTGLIAQKVKNIIPEAVYINKSRMKIEDDIIFINDLHCVNYTCISSYIISAIQHLKEKINKLENSL